MPDFETSPSLDDAAINAWQALLVKAKLPQDGWSLTALARRDDKKTSRISYIAAHHDLGAFTFKFQLRPQANDRFAENYNMQAQAYRGFPHSAQFTMPKPVFLDAETQSSLMQFVNGCPLSEPMRDAAHDRDRQLELLQLSGRWLDAFHRSNPLEPRQFQPRHTVRYYNKLRENILSGETKVVEELLFLKGIAKLNEIAPQFEDMPTISTVQHGDYHMRNLIFDGESLAGIDVSSAKSGPVGYDIAKILLDYTTIMRTDQDLVQGEVVPNDAMDAFFRGYPLVSQDDPSVRFLLYARILATLTHVPQNPSERTHGKQQTLSRMRPIAEVAFSSTK